MKFIYSLKSRQVPKRAKEKGSDGELQSTLVRVCQSLFKIQLWHTIAGLLELATTMPNESGYFLPQIHVKSPKILMRQIEIAPAQAGLSVCVGISIEIAYQIV